MSTIIIWNAFWGIVFILPVLSKVQGLLGKIFLFLLGAGIISEGGHEEVFGLGQDVRFLGKISWDSEQATGDCSCPQELAGAHQRGVWRADSNFRGKQCWLGASTHKLCLHPGKADVYNIFLAAVLELPCVVVLLGDWMAFFWHNLEGFLVPP